MKEKNAHFKPLPVPFFDIELTYDLTCTNCNKNVVFTCTRWSRKNDPFYYNQISCSCGGECDFKTTPKQFSIQNLSNDYRNATGSQKTALIQKDRKARSSKHFEKEILPTLGHDEKIHHAKKKRAMNK